MSENSSSSSNGSSPRPHPSSFDSPLSPGLYCLMTRPSSFIFATYSITKILLLLPLSILVLYLGVQRWRRQRSSSTAAPMSHCDCFTYHLVVIELIGVIGCFLCCYGIYCGYTDIALLGVSVLCFTWNSEMYFHVLTCVERYLAVVHPITYLSLRKERGIRIRNVCIGFVWLLSVSGIYVLITNNIFMLSAVLIFSITVTCACSLCVLCVLIRPGPGEHGGGGGARVDRSKLRAFYTITVILGVLLLRFTCNLTWIAIVVTNSYECGTTMCDIWFNLPSSVVLPVLFLHRSGKLVCCKRSIG